MRTLTALICSFALASLASAAQQDDEGHNQGKKKGGGNAEPQPAAVQSTTVTPKVHGQHHNAKFNTQGPATSRMQHDPSLNHGGGSLSKVQANGNGNAAYKTKLGKTKFSSQTNLTGGGNVKFQKKHFNLANKPNQNYQAVKFNQNYKIAGANKWKGAKYQVFVNYQPQWHDQYWWTSHHNHIVFFFGAPYYWDSGYCYPAWGYYPGANYYYDGPIYASNPDVDLGQEVANVQAALQEQGYYHGEIDGVIGPQTRAALAEYQSAQGLEPTGTVDEPTLETLGMV